MPYVIESDLLPEVALHKAGLFIALNNIYVTLTLNTILFARQRALNWKNY